ncbi:MAG: ATP-binding cassette domain-containing protein, partial [Methylibium sp.]|nr:ATP-binding cassette domain-containing protein [Methylibium sp.]
YRSLRGLAQPERPTVSLDRHRRFHLGKAASTLLTYYRDGTLELALKTDRRVRAAVWARLSGAEHERIDAVLERIHLKAQAGRLAGLLSHGQKQWLEIGMLLMQDPKLLLLDEPVAGMTDEETERTAELFLSLQGEHSLVVVEHDMSFIDTLTRDDPQRKVTVLHEGRVLAEGSLAQVQADDKVVEVYLGR